MDGTASPSVRLTLCIFASGPQRRLRQNVDFVAVQILLYWLQWYEPWQVSDYSIRLSLDLPSIWDAFLAPLQQLLPAVVGVVPVIRIVFVMVFPLK